jgi:hypothetical protein
VFLAVYALAHIHDFSALLPAIGRRVACDTAGCCVGVGVGVLVQGQFARESGAAREERVFILCSRACLDSTATALLAWLLE